MAKELKNKPLVEAIFELRRKLRGNHPAPQIDIGRIVSRAEALRLAQQILVNAERERLAVAEFEAARGIQWGEGEIGRSFILIDNNPEAVEVMKERLGIEYVVQRDRGLD